MLYYRCKYHIAVTHHQEAACVWQRMMMNIMSEQIAHHFKGSMVSNHIIRYRNNKIEISIGNENILIPVDMQLFKNDVAEALDKAYSELVNL